MMFDRGKMNENEKDCRQLSKSIPLSSGDGVVSGEGEKSGPGSRHFAESSSLIRRERPRSAREEELN